MRFLVGADAQRLGRFFRQLLVRDLGLLLAPLHQLDGEREAEHACDEGESQHFAAFGLHRLAGVALPDGGVLRLLVGDAQQRGAVVLVLGAGRDAPVHFGFGHLVLLEDANLCERFGGELRGRGGCGIDHDAPRCFFFGSAASISDSASRGCYFPVAPHLSRPMSDPVHPMVPPVAKKARIRKFRSVPQALRKTLFLVIPGHRSALHGYRHAVPS